MHPLGVFDSKYAKAYVTTGDETKATFTCEVAPAPDALSKEYDTDAHFCLYHIPGEETWPRLKKTSPRGLDLLGLKIKVQYLAVDWDLPGHGEWTLEQFNEFFERLDIIEGTFPEIKQYCALYTTRGGAHIVWALDRPVDPHVAEGHLRGLTARLRALGLEVDELHDWTRLMRCPAVHRRGKPTWENEPFHMLEVSDQTISPEQLPYVKVEEKANLEVDEIIGTRPRPAEIPEDDPKKQIARQRLTGRESFDAAFGRMDANSFGASGTRNTNIFKYVGQATGLLYDTGIFEPEDVYQLFRAAAADCEHHPGKEHPLDQLWRAVKTSWEREEAQDKEDKKKAKAEYQELEADWETICEGFLSWASVPGIESTTDARAYLQDKLILITPSGSGLIMTRNGFYDRVEASKSQLVGRVRQLGMTKLINCYKANTAKPKPAQEILDIYGLPVNSVAAGPEYDDGTVVIGIDSGMPTAVLPMFQRNKSLTPQYNADVDLWLRKMCKRQEDYEKLVEWVSHSLDFSVPIAALALVGASGIGKKMFMLGLAECFLPPRIADFTNVVSGFGDVLLETPLIWGNEGFPQNQGRGKRIADLIRELVAGDPISVNRKFKTPVQVQANFRIVVTANNDSCLTNLYAGQDLTADDRSAIARRIVHIEASDNARIFLRSKGGLKFTGRPGHRWVANQSGGVSNYVVARHFLYLHENRKEIAEGARFAVEGHVGSGTMVDDMALASGVAPKVVESLLAISVAAHIPDGVVIVPPEGDDSGQASGVYVTTNAVKQIYRKLPYVKNLDSLNDKNVGNVLLSLCETHFLGSINGRKAHWYKLNLAFLFSQATRNGAAVGERFTQFEEQE